MGLETENVPAIYGPDGALPVRTLSTYLALIITTALPIQ